jgi:hypothetical protein
MALLRLLRQGLLERGTDRDIRRYSYALSSRGWDRRRYLIHEMDAAVPRGPGRRVRRSREPLQDRQDAFRRPGSRRPGSSGDDVGWQCPPCGAPADPLYGRSEWSWCPSCGGCGTVMGQWGEYPFPHLYGAWLQVRGRRTPGGQAGQADNIPIARRKGIGDTGATMKRPKIHSGVFHCPECLVEFELLAEESQNATAAADRWCAANSTRMTLRTEHDGLWGHRSSQCNGWSAPHLHYSRRNTVRRADGRRVAAGVDVAEHRW